MEVINEVEKNSYLASPFSKTHYKFNVYASDVSGYIGADSFDEAVTIAKRLHFGNVKECLVAGQKVIMGDTISIEKKPIALATRE